ncbi:pilus assembly protein TadG-related protein [Acidocella aromatica]|nr:pilus assembly protein TadG-related protein [Acidocella aromatica]
MFALSMPMLLAVTGLSVDVGYWYQNQTALQSAADAGAMAAAMNDARLGQTTDDTKVSAALPYAKAMADAATSQQFGFVSGAPGTSVTLTANTGTAQTVNSKSVATTTYTATVSAPRPVFFSAVGGAGLQGFLGRHAKRQRHRLHRYHHIGH